MLQPPAHLCTSNTGKRALRNPCSSQFAAPGGHSRLANAWLRFQLLQLSVACRAGSSLLVRALRSVQCPLGSAAPQHHCSRCSRYE